MRKIIFLYVVCFFMVVSPVFSFDKLSISDFESIKETNKYEYRVLVVNVFAPWCPPCIVETPDLVNIYNAKVSGKGLLATDGVDYEIIGLAVDTKKDELKKFVKDFKIKYPVYHIDKKLRKKLFAEWIPTTVIYGSNGVYYTSFNGIVTETQLYNAIKKAGGKK